MTNEQREAIETIKIYLHDWRDSLTDEDGYGAIVEEYDIEFMDAIDTVLSLIKEQQEREELIKEYVHQEIVNYTETIRDYIDDDKEGNKDYIGELKEDREHWKDIEKILQNKPKEELYMNWWRYGLYE